MVQIRDGMLIVMYGFVGKRAVSIGRRTRNDTDRCSEVEESFRIVLLVQPGEAAPIVGIGIARIAFDSYTERSWIERSKLPFV